MSDLLTFREQIAAQGAVPRWLRGTRIHKLLYVAGLHLDYLADTLTWGVLARFPGYCPSAIPYLCRDRNMTRGPEENDAQICARIRGFRKAATIKGSPTSVVTQLRGYLAPHFPRVRAINNQGRYVEISAAGELSRGDAPWNWDGNTELNTRFWVLIWVPPALWQIDTFDQPGAVGDGGVIGSSAPLEVVTGITSLIHEWSCENSRHMATILIFDDAAWQAQQPDGTWWRMDRRNPSANYWEGDR